MSDLVSRVLSAITQREKPELEARGDHNLGWTLSGDTADQVMARCLYCSWVAEGLEHDVDPLADDHVRSCSKMPPSDELRLCRSLRDIVTLHQPDELNGRVYCAHCAGLCHSETGLGCEVSGDAPFPCDTFLLMARGLGIEEDTDG